MRKLVAASEDAVRSFVPCASTATCARRARRLGSVQLQPSPVRRRGAAAASAMNARRSVPPQRPQPVAAEAGRRAQLHARVAVFIYGLIAWNGYLSLSASRMLPQLRIRRLRAIRRAVRSDRWWVALQNLGIFGVLFIGGCAWRSACCWPSCSTRRSAPKACCARSTSTRWRCRFIVTGTAWKWILNPGLGLEQLVHELGFTELHVRLAGQPRQGDLLRRHRRHLAGARAS